jgi:hypothetical protein
LEKTTEKIARGEEKIKSIPFLAVPLLNNGITINSEHELCVKWENIGCSGGEQYEEWLKNIYYPMYKKVYGQNDLTSISIYSQDLAVFFSSIGMVFEITGVPELHTTTNNPLESGSSWISTTATILNDKFYTNKSHFNKSNTLVVDEATAQSFLMSSVGQIIPFASVDVVIDVYSASYNHGNSPGIMEIMGLKTINIFDKFQIGE